MTDVSAAQTNPVAPTLTSRERFNRAARCLPVDRPPVWLMRQAGRALPEYRKLKETYTFVQLVQNPELAAEVTLQPARRFGFDAAILFSDILVIPEALGQTYHFKETGGVVMDFAVTSKTDIEKLSVEHVVERLSYVDQALRILRKELGDQTALLGFTGSPWTLATFMMEGASVPKYSRALQLFREDTKTYYALAEKLTAAVTAYLKMQIATGVAGSSNVLPPPSAIIDPPATAEVAACTAAYEPNSVLLNAIRSCAGSNPVIVCVPAAKVSNPNSSGAGGVAASVSPAPRLR